MLGLSITILAVCLFIVFACRIRDKWVESKKYKERRAREFLKHISHLPYHKKRNLFYNLSGVDLKIERDLQLLSSKIQSSGAKKIILNELKKQVL